MQSARPKEYSGKRDHDHGCSVLVNGLPLNPRFDLRNHSPTGFEWGYGGSGPAQLALAILADCLGEEEALKKYQDFKFKVVGRLPEPGWILTEAAVRSAVDREPNDARQET